MTTTSPTASRAGGWTRTTTVDAFILIEAARCVGCGLEFKRYAFNGDLADMREFPALMPRADVEAGGGKCARCGGQVLMQLAGDGE